MDTVTYPDSAVQEYMGQHFAPLSINLFDRHPDFKEASAGTRVPWAPTLVFSDAKGRELRRFTGWLPPRSFVAELTLVRGIAAVGQGDFAQGAQLFDHIDQTAGDTEVAAEGLYWLGIARFLAGSKDMKALAECWHRLLEEHPGSRFATHASVIADSDAGEADRS